MIRHQQWPAGKGDLDHSLLKVMCALVRQRQQQLYHTVIENRHQVLTCDGHSDTVAGRDLAAVHMDHGHLKVARALVRQRQRQVHEGVKLDGMELTVFHGTDQG